jgi:hypothetical protein
MEIWKCFILTALKVALDYEIRKVQENQEGLESNTCQFLVHDDSVDLLDKREIPYHKTEKFN